MGALLHAVALLSLATAGIGILYLLFSAVCVLRFRGCRVMATGELPPVSVLVPLCGAEPGLKRRLRRLSEQDYGSQLQIICGVGDPAGEAVEVVRALAHERPDVDLRIAIDPSTHGRNPKISNLINMIERADHDVFLFIDSDIEAPPDFVGKLVGLLQRPGVGAVTCLYYGRAAGGVWARLSAAGITSHFLPDAVAGLSLQLARPCFGATIALTRGMLWRIGGLRPFADCLWDDYALGEAVRRTGSDVAVAPFALPHICAERSARELLSRELRSARTIKGIAPVGYVGNLFTHPLGFALVALMTGWSGPALAVGALAIVARAWLCGCLRRRFGTAVPVRLQPLRDLLAFAVYLGGCFGNKVVWRGKAYRVTRSGTLNPVRNGRWCAFGGHQRPLLRVVTTNIRSPESTKD
jgi:ceramide glucosyltransferase